MGSTCIMSDEEECHFEKSLASVDTPAPSTLRSMDNQQEVPAIVFPSRAGNGDKQVLQRIHDRNLVRIGCAGGLYKRVVST